MLKKFLFTVMLSMVPIIELRGGIPFGVTAGLGFRMSILAAIIGNILPVPFIMLFIQHVFAWLRKKSRKLDGLVNRLEERAHKKGDMVRKYSMIGLFLLVAIPLPGTGAWTGSLVAAVLEVPLRRAVPAIVAGVIAAAVIVTGITYGVAAFV